MYIGTHETQTLAPTGATNFIVSHTESGGIPDCLGLDQHELYGLSLIYNELSGPIPESLCQIGTSLELLLLYANSLTGRENVYAYE